MDDKDRTIRIQQSLIDKLETEIDRANEGSETPTIEQIDTINTATQTERVKIKSYFYPSVRSNLIVCLFL